MEIEKVGVVGLGLMGSGIAQVAAAAGFETVAREASEELVAKGLGAIDAFLGKAVEKGKTSADEKAALLGRLRGTTRIEDLSGCDIVIEAVTESLAVKREVFV